VSALSERIRPELARPTPYRWQEGIPDGPVDRFDMNTPADPPAWYASALARLAAIPPNDYPDASYLPLKRAIASYAGTETDQLVVGAGCDEVLGLCAMLALAPGARAVVGRPTYQLYAVASRNAGAELVEIEPRPGTLAIDWDAVLEAAAEARVVWLCSPNNPTGDEPGAERVDALCRACPGIVVADQAYLELGGEDLLPLIADHENLVVARTFSKGFALGAARVGYGVAQPELAGALDALRPPGSLAAWSAATAELACAEAAEMRARCTAIVHERERLADGMRRAGVGVDAAAGNFVLARTPVPDLFERLAERGLIVRTFGHEPLLADRFRVTVADRPADDRLLSALAELAGGEGPPEPTPFRGRTATRRRDTRETRVACTLALDGSGRADVRTGLGFLDHMLTALAFWSLIDIELRCAGDLWVDEHHTVEDCAIALGETLDTALGDRAGLARFGSASAPLDEALAEATVDLSGRGVAVVDLALRGTRVGEVAASLLPHFLDTLARRARIGLHVRSRGGDDHHVTEAAFKATALALRQAVALDPARQGVASTKGVL